ncbi:hypothetical protein [Caldivirga maquilingensis]|uniref:Uncharacterized protein n=1 Tax=Caldivirga maquilingensis (strain ATCC 700844 / DSM 13496 / JCM 10307 / IC-167) TaxID=397948 RepID=A8MAI3_CALMQ|nr:hypothetical protein [Caldivirga maquilingensis]ABW02560.1 hypothetical protein Cmaq_1737 [Caldivirga maquilingensis IC-167]
MGGGNSSQITLYMYAPSLFLDLYIGSSLLANRYINCSIPLTSLINDAYFRKILTNNLTNYVKDEEVGRIIKNLKHVSLISIINPTYVVKKAENMVNLIKNYENRYRDDITEWYSRVTNRSNLPYSKMIYSLKHTIKITRGMVRHYLYKRAQGLIRKSTIDSLMLYMSVLPNTLAEYLNVTSKSDAMAVIFITSLIDKYSASYPIHLIFEVSRRVLAMNPRLLKDTLNGILTSLSPKSNYYNALLAELTRIYIYNYGSLDDVQVNYLVFNSTVADNLLSEHSTELIKSRLLSSMLYEYIYRLSLLSINNDLNSLHELSKILGNTKENLIKAILNEWSKLNDELTT